MAWLFLIFAGLLEIVWATALKQSAGFSKLAPSVITIVALAGSMWLLALAMRSLPLGTAYAVWTGIGAAGAAIVGIVMLGDAATPLRLGGVGLILAGVIALRVAEG